MLNPVRLRNRAKRPRRVSLFRIAVPVAALVPAIAGAHSFGRVYSLPVPFRLYVYGAAVALMLSFAVVAYFVTGHLAEPEVDRDDRGWVRAPRGLVRALRVSGVLGLLLCIVTGLFGTRNPYTNFNMTFFWIVFVLGFTYLTALTGDLYSLANPWSAMAEAIERFWPRYGVGLFGYPRRVAYWPAFVLYVAFVWIELFAEVKPFSLAAVLLAYGAINLAGVALVGKAQWFRHCEFLGVFFSLVAKMAPCEWRSNRVRLRAPFVGLLWPRAEHPSVLVFVLFMLSSTAFDGLRETVPWMNLYWIDVYQLVKPWVGANPIEAYPTLRHGYLLFETLALLLSPFVYLGAYVAFVAMAKVVARSALSVRELALRFTFSLLPIALAYNVTHYYTLILTQGVRIVSLVSDPFGAGWNLLGTAGWLRAPILSDPTVVWHTQVLLIVFGHVVSVSLAHLEALRTFPTRRQATLSQLPMLLLMVAFTTAGLWILAQPIKPGV